MQPKQLQNLITATVNYLDKEIGEYFNGALNKPEAVDLLFGTCCVESDCGYRVRQISGPALGIMQMEPATHYDIWLNFIANNAGLLEFATMYLVPYGYNKTTTKIIAERMQRHLEFDLRYAIIMARLHYYRVSAAIPELGPGYITDLGEYWKKYYNTIDGRGGVGEFVVKFNKYGGIE